jgi:Tir chaperone protein (CesT) family
MDNFESLIQEFGTATGIENMQPDQDGAVQFLIDDKLPVFIQPDRERKYLSIYAVVGLVDETVPGPLMLELLTASLFGREANGASFAIEESMGQIVLQHHERLDGLTYSEFEQVLHGFVDAAEAWMVRLAPDAAGDEPATMPSPHEMNQIHIKA